MVLFISSFLNTGIITLLTNANLSEAPFPLNLLPLRGEYEDFTQHWFLDIGFSLEKSMIITAVYPWLEIIIFGGIVWFKRWRDSGTLRRCSEIKSTKCTTQ